MNMEIIEFKFFVWFDNFMKIMLYGEVMMFLSYFIVCVFIFYVVFILIFLIILRFFC